MEAQTPRRRRQPSWKPVTGSSPSPVCRQASGAAPARRMCWTRGRICWDNSFPNFLSPSFVRPPARAILSSRPTRSCGHRAQWRSRTAPPPGGRPKGLSLTAVSTVASSSVSGLAPPSLVPNSKHAPRLDARFRPYGTNWRGALPFWGADDRVAKSGEEDGIPAALPSLYCRSSFAASAHPGRFGTDFFALGRSFHAATNRTYAPSACATNARSTSRRDLML